MTLRKQLLTACLLFLLTPSAWSASVSAVKGQKVLINLDGDSANEGDEFFLINPGSNKKTALIRIRQIKGNKAMGEIIKGRAATGYSLQAKAPGSMSAGAGGYGDSSYSRAQESGILRNLKNSYGITGGYLMNTMSANVTAVDSGTGIRTTSAANMSGGGLAVGGFYDYLLSSSFVAHGVVGIEQFNVTGDAAASVCSGSKSCDAKINYLAMYGAVKWYLTQEKYRVWLGGGIGYLMALSKSSSALNASQISTNQVFNLAVGTDMQMSRKNYVPISLEYNLFPSSETVKASNIMIKAGWAWNL